MTPASHGDETSIDLSRVAVIIPALNEEASIGRVLTDLPDGPLVIVVDNGSTDRTDEVAIQHGAVVVTESQRGYGAACLRGIRELRTRTESMSGFAAEVVAFIDADYSDHPELLPQLVAPIFQDEADFVLGSRILGQREPGAMPPQSLFGNRLACWLMRLFFSARYTDLGPFRAIDYHRLIELGMTDTNFGWTVEMQIKAARRNLKTLEIPVPYRCRVGTSKISGTISGSIKAGYKILYLIFKYGFFASRKQPKHNASR